MRFSPRIDNLRNRYLDIVLWWIQPRQHTPTSADNLMHLYVCNHIQPSGFTLVLYVVTALVHQLYSIQHL